MNPSKGLDRLPLWLAMPYLLFTYALFFIGPFVWPVKAWWVIYAYVPGCFAALWFGFRLGARGEAKGADFRPGMTFFYVGTVASLLLIVPMTLTYTGKLPWEVGAALTDQREAYSALGAQLAETSGRRGPIALARGLVGPFVYCALPIGILFWRSLSWVQRALFIGTAATLLDLAILRGTTAPIADLFVITGSAALVRIGSSGRGLSTLLRYWKWAIGGLVGAGLIVVVVIGHVEARMGGTRVGCLANSGVCANVTTGVYGQLSDYQALGMASVSGYFAQGYYGLSLAAEKPFQSTYGIGHSLMLAAQFVNFGGSEDIPNRSYTYRARADGWSDEYQYSTLMAWLANDVDLLGAIVLVFGLGWLWGRSWIDATRGGDVRAAIFFCILMQVIFYLPASAYVFNSIDTYAAFLFWFAVWGIGRRRRLTQ